MGRKIPGRKHHGVRDPDKQNQRRLALIKDKINAPPANSDEQRVPKSLTRLVDLRSKVKSGAIGLKRKRNKPTPLFRQKDGESDERFMHRVSQVCHGVLQEARFEDRYGVNIKRDALTGEVTVVKRPKDEIEEYHKKVKKELKSKKKKKNKDEAVTEKLTKSQKRSAKLKVKKEKVKNLNYDEFKAYKDTVQFGDVAHAPPNLVVPKKIQNNDQIQRPGQRDLLLKALIKGKGNNLQESDRKQTENKIIDKKGKRKDLPTALRRQLDKQQQEVIHAYKLLKAKKYVRE